MSEVELSIILPCYDEGAALPELVEGYRSVLTGLVNVELILVDNGSRDNTWELLQKEAKKHQTLNIVPLRIEEPNRGYGGGILYGIERSKGDYIAWSHADLQCPPEDVLRLYRKVLENPKPRNCFGRGSRINREGGSVLLTRLQTAFSFLILGYKLVEINAQPKLFHRNMLRSFKEPPKGYELDLYALYKARQARMDIVSVDVEFKERKAGSSKWSYSLVSIVCSILKVMVYTFRLRLFGHRL